MKFLKRALPIVLAVCLLASLCAVSAIDAGETRTVIGADLTDEQIKTVYKTFGIERGSVKELTVTNKDERQYLSGVISDAQIGTKSISCISIEVLDAGKGMTVNTSHITYCTSQMYISALATAGITDAKITVTAPFDVSGTAALTGVYKAYEDITGTKLDETAKAVSSQELATTAELAQAIGDYDSVEIVNELKLILNETKDMTDAELRAKIKEIAAEYDPDSRGGDPADGRKVKGATIHWVDAATAVDAEVRLYDNLFTDANPDAADKDFIECLNPGSLEVLTDCKVEAGLAAAADRYAESHEVGKTAPGYQFMRLGYFCLDNKDTKAGHPVFNRSVSLKDSFKK